MKIYCCQQLFYFFELPFLCLFYALLRTLLLRQKAGISLPEISLPHCHLQFAI